MRTTSHHLPLLALLLALPLAALLCATGLPGPSVVRAATVTDLTIGSSAQGRPITAVRFGDGPRKLVVVSDTHGGPEANTHILAQQLIEHFRAHPEEIPPAVRLYIIPTLNPDGLAMGWRFDAAGVDLNRNMNTNLDSCADNDWNVTVQGAGGVVSDTGGQYPDSQLESRLIRDFLLDASGAIFLHSNAGLVFPAFCEHGPSIALGQTYADAAGYVYSRFWPRYLITGGMHDWAGSLGIAAITPELVSADDSEFDANLAALRAVLARGEELLPVPEDRFESDIAVPALIWRYWRALGGEATFGQPLAPAQFVEGGAAQLFSRATLVLQYAQADTRALVQPAALGRSAALAYTGSTIEQFFAGEEHLLQEAFADYWQRTSGEQTLGRPISEEFVFPAADGSRRVLQYFERGALAYYPERAGSAQAVQPEPLGWQALQRANALAPTSPHQVR